MEEEASSSNINSSSSILPTLHRRRRRKKNYGSNLSSSSQSQQNTSAMNQDAKLEQEVVSYLQWDGGTLGSRNCNTRKKRSRRVYGGTKEYDDLDWSEKDNVDTKDIKKGAPTNSTSLPMLLHVREIGQSFHRPGRRFTTSWKSQILYQSISVPNNHERYSNPLLTANQSNKQTWKPNTKQSIPFSKLQTPITDAILALSRFGSYLIGVGSIPQGVNVTSHPIYKTCPHLILKFYGVPSPCRLKQIEDQKDNSTNSSSMTSTRVTITSPLIHAVPLLFKNSNSQIENQNHPCPSGLLGHNEYESPAANIPIKVLLSQCESVGVAFLHHSTAAWNSSSGGSNTFSESPAHGEDVLGTIVIFAATPTTVIGKGSSSRSTRLTTSYHLSNVRIGGWNAFTMRNLLWPTTLIPTTHVNTNESDSPTTFQYLRQTLSAYMLFNDEDDGFRITWISISESSLENEEILCTSKPSTIRPTRNDIVTKSEDNVWEIITSDSQTGCYPNTKEDEDDNVNFQSKSKDGLRIAFELYLHIDALLSDIMSRRQASLFKNTPYQNERVSFMPDFYYNLVSVSPDNLRVTVIIVFSNKEKQMHSTKKVPSALGVFVQVNLFDQSYNEIKWLQHPTLSDDAASMNQWCNSLALNWRMKECRVGVFCLDSAEVGSKFDSWTCKTHEENADDDLVDDRNINLWSDYITAKKAQGAAAKVPKDISMLSLYPHCDIITNRAVVQHIPVKRIPSRSSPIELIYG